MLLINSILKDRPRSNPVKAGIVRGANSPNATLIHYLVFISLTLVIEVILLIYNLYTTGLTHQLQVTGEPKLDSKEHGLGWFLDCDHLSENV